MKIPHSKPSLDREEELAVQKVLRSGKLASGGQVTAFERTVASGMKRTYAIGLNSGTSALHLALIASDVHRDDEVVFPSYSCAALINAVGYVGAKPRFCDVNEFGQCGRDEIASVITPRTKAIILPHLFGKTQDLGWAFEFGVTIIEDCAQSIGALNGQRLSGGWGHLTVLSFYATKVITTGEGGMVLCDDPAMADRVRALSSYDKIADTTTRFNYKMTEIAAAIGLAQYRKLPEFIATRRSIARIYDGALQPSTTARPLFPCDDQSNIFFRYILKTDENRFKAILDFLRRKGIRAEKPIFEPLHLRFQTEHPLVLTSSLDKCLISIPLYPAMKVEEFEAIAASLKEIS